MLSAKDELQDRVEAKRKELEAKLAELKADSKQSVRQQVDGIEEQLAQYRKYLSDGWNNLSEEGARYFNRWLEDKK